MALPFPDAGYDAALSLLILQEVPDAPLAVREMHRVTRPGGCVATCQWDFAGGLPMLAHFWDVVNEVFDDGALRALASEVMEVKFPDPSSLRKLWMDSGMVDVRVEAIEIEMRFSDFEDYWLPFESGVTDTSSVAGNLDADERRILMESLRRRVADDDPGRPFSLPARAWAVRGVVG